MHGDGRRSARRERVNLSPSLPSGAAHSITVLSRRGFSRKTSRPRAAAPSLSGFSAPCIASGCCGGGIFLRCALPYGMPGGMEPRLLHRGADLERRGEGLWKGVRVIPL
jgi:hypothetical protein